MEPSIVSSAFRFASFSALPVMVGLSPLSAAAQSHPEVATLTAPELASVAHLKGAEFIDTLVARMTLEEKLGQLTQYTGHGALTGTLVRAGSDPEIKRGTVGSFLNVYGADATRTLQQVAARESRLGIPLLFGYDVVHGFRTIFPVPLAESCSWDPELARRTARVAAIEASAAGLHWTFAPMVDISRDARWGRIVEGAGEDPYLGSVLAAARVHGFQGESLAAPDTVMACAKHFAAYGAAEAGRDYNTVDISPRTLWEVYLPPFRATVDAGVGSFMSAFNEISGVPSTANHHLLTDVLRDQWGFDGMVVSDYTAVLELVRHGIADSPAEAGRVALTAGTDMDMVSGIYSEDLPALVRDGRLPENVVDTAVRRVLRAKYRLGLFDDPYRYSDPERERTLLLAEDHRALAREAARKSIVLLKNERRTLPLTKDPGTLAVIGPLADNRAAMLGSWSAVGRATEAISLLAGIRQAVTPDTRVLDAKGCDVNSDKRRGIAQAVQLAKQADAVILVLGEDERMSGEAASRTSLDLPGVQGELADAVIATGTPTVVVLINGRPLTIGDLAAHAAAVVEAWQPGTEAGHAIADVLFGDYNPSGRLTVTFPRTVGQVPLYYNHKNTGRPPSATDRFTSKYLDAPWTPLYPFGYGLSYTTFNYHGLRVARDVIAPSDSVDVSVDVTNTGRIAGDEVVQLYLQDEVATVTRPVEELRGFRKVHLNAGETKSVAFTLRPDDLAMYDQGMHRVVEPGWFKVYVGANSADHLAARFRVAEN